MVPVQLQVSLQVFWLHVLVEVVLKLPQLICNTSVLQTDMSTELTTMVVVHFLPLRQWPP